MPLGQHPREDTALSRLPSRTDKQKAHSPRELARVPSWQMRGRAGVRVPTKLLLQRGREKKQTQPSK